MGRPFLTFTFTKAGRPNTSSIIVLSLLLSWILWCLTFPDLFLWQRLSFLRYDESNYPYRNVFTLVSNFYHGGIGLWNPYDQMPMLFAHLATGLYSFNQLFVALMYVLLSPLFASPAKAFYLIY